MEKREGLTSPPTKYSRLGKGLAHLSIIDINLNLSLYPISYQGGDDYRGVGVFEI
jgi:hypothetical protein